MGLLPGGRLPEGLSPVGLLPGGRLPGGLLEVRGSRAGVDAGPWVEGLGPTTRRVSQL